MKYKFVKLLVISLGLSASVVKADEGITLSQAINLAQQNDPWLHASQLQQQATQDKSVAAGELPDPKLSIGLMNMPTDTFNFGQEAMTQFSLGLTQMFPRGSSLQIKQQQLQLASSKFPLLREDRKAKLATIVAELWLNAYLAQQSIALIEQDRALFEQMADVANASYSNAVGKTQQQDVIRAQLEIIQLEDRLTVEQQKLDTSLAALNEWLHVFAPENLDSQFNFEGSTSALTVSSRLPSLALLTPELLSPAHYSRNKMASVLANHPAILAVEVEQKVKLSEVELAKQQYQPQWAVNASYGYRDNMPSGEGRADLFSLGVSVDLPLFTENRQDKQVSASIAESEAVKTEKLLLIKQMLSALEKNLKQLTQLEKRQSLYRQQLLKQTHDQAEASLTAYTNDDGDFSEVVRARVAELNAHISALKIDLDRLKTISRINYFLLGAQPSSAKHDPKGEY
ncbi:TolC family protein [Paraglaciecola aestuariivivens]